MASNEAVKDDDWEKAEGVPSMSEPFIQKYMAGRDALVQQEKKQRSGRLSLSRSILSYIDNLTTFRLPFPPEPLAHGTGGGCNSLTDSL